MKVIHGMALSSTIELTAHMHKVDVLEIDTGLTAVLPG